MIAIASPNLTPRVTLPKPLRHQLPVILSPARFKVVCCGRRWGKTAAGLLAVTRGHGRHRRDLRGAIDGGQIWWVGPSFPVAAKIWRDLKRATKNAWIDKSEVERRIEFPGGGSITVKSADNPDSLVGDGLDGLVIDEAALIAKEAWTESLRPTVADKQGWVIFISTPNGFNWFKDLFDKSNNRTGWERWQRPSSDNPLMTAQELDDALLDMGEVAFAQQHGAQFANMDGAEFSAAYFPDAMWFDDWPDLDTGFVHRVQTCDPSLGATDRSDYQAHILMGLDRFGTMWIEGDLQRQDRVQIVGHMLDLARWFRPEAIGIESNMWQVLLADQLYWQSKASGMSLPIWPMQNWEKKTTRIRATLTPYLSRREFRFRNTPGTKLLVQQLRAFPFGEHDDGADSLELGVRLMRDIFQRHAGGGSGGGNEQGEAVAGGMVL